MHVVAIACPDPVVAGDLATPCEVFGRAVSRGGHPLYEVRVCGASRRVRTAWFSLDVPFALTELEHAHTVVVPGIPDLRGPIDPRLVDAIRAAHRRGARVVSICTGAFVVAAAGLLDGLHATTHWAAARALADAHPEVSVVPEVLYADEGQVLTSAGAAAGLDLCLHLVRKDFGASVAAHTARMAVMPLERPGGQAQFVVHPTPTADDTLQPLLVWVDAHLTEDLSVVALARRAAMSPRTLARRFREQLDETPAQWVVRARVRRAQQLLETTNLSIEEIGAEVGFGSSVTLRERFRHVVGTSPTAYRRAFGS